MMDNPQGRVVSITAPHQIVVEVDAQESCARCAAGKGCGAGLLSGAAKIRRIEVTAPADLPVRVGDTVTLALNPRDILRASLFVYGLPMAGAVAAAIAAYNFGFGDAAAAVSALAGIMAGLAVARFRLRQANCLRQFTPSIVGHNDHSS